MRFFSLAALTTAVTAADIPVLPDGFSSTIEAVISNKKYTTTLREIYDQENDRMRVDRRARDGRQTEICDMKHGQHIIVTRNESGTFCQSKSIQTCFIAQRSKDGHLPSASAMLEQIKTTEYTQEAQETMRGITCDIWKSAEVNQGSPRRPGVNTTYTLTWAFQAQDWGQDPNGERVPVAVVLEGAHLNTTTMVKSGEFSHTYNFIEFYSSHDQHAMGNPDHYFEIHSSYNCPDSVTTAPDSTANKTGDGSGANGLKCGEGTEAKNGECVCKGNDDSKTTGAANEADDSKTSGGRSLMQTVYDTAVNWAGFVPGVLAGFTLGQ